MILLPYQITLAGLIFHIAILLGRVLSKRVSRWPGFEFVNNVRPQPQYEETTVSRWANNVTVISIKLQEQH